MGGRVTPVWTSHHEETKPDFKPFHSPTQGSDKETMQSREYIVCHHSPHLSIWHKPD